ncbi:hypothetical protein HQ489_02765 [Candidatus Woesearchaeota archaeon]|nr:hypothetical protein [Candidatus Woesearchaeota archaeon]
MPSTVLPSVAEFIDWAILIVTLLMIYYFVKWVAFSGKEGEEDKKRSEMVGDYFKKRKEKKEETLKKSKEKIEQKKREEHVRHPQAHFVESIEHCTELIVEIGEFKSAEDDTAKKAVLEKLKEHHKELKNKLKEGTRGLNTLRRKEHKGELHAWLQSIYEYGGATWKLTNEITIPKHDDTECDKKLDSLEKNIQTVRGACGNILRKLEEYIEKGKADMLTEMPKFPESSSSTPRGARGHPGLGGALGGRR